MKVKRIVPVVLIVAVAGIAAYAYLRNRPEHNSDLIRVSGNIEVTEVTVGFEAFGRVATRLVDEGQVIGKNDVIATVETSIITNVFGIAKARAAEAQAGLTKLEAGSRPQEIAVATAAVASAKAEAERSKLDFRRTEDLLKNKTVSQQDYDASKATHEVAVARLHEAEERLKLAVEGPRREEIDQGRARVLQSESMVALAATLLGNATLKSPVAGIVLSKNIEPGEYVFPGTPVVTIGNLDNVWLRAYVNETDLGRVKVGQKVRVTTDTYPDKVYDGRVSFIASEAEFTPKSVQTPTERVKLVYRIKVDIANPQMELKPGMPADGEIQLQ